jgi:hypothetical protein
VQVHNHASRADARTVDAARFGWGVLLLARPQPLLRSVGASPGRKDAAVARVLGARHILQALALAMLPLLPSRTLGTPAVRRRVRRLGAVADAAHAASAFALAATGRAPLTWAADGVVASTFAGATWQSAGTPRRERH